MVEIEKLESTRERWVRHIKFNLVEILKYEENG